MLKRSLLPVLLLLVLLIPAVVADAQGPPDAINDALNDLSARAGKTVTLASLSDWSWAQTNYPDSSLGCPQPGQAYVQKLTNGYQFLLTYSGATYDYRVSADRTILFLCNPPAVPPTATPIPAGATPRATPSAPAGDATGEGRVVCPDAMPTRLIAGTNARATADGVPKNIRSAPTTSSTIRGQVPAGEEIAILDGPHCAEGLVWWQIDYDTLVGWVAEGQNNTYWLVPLSNPVPTPVAAVTPTPQAAAGPQIYDLPADRQPITPANAGQMQRFADLPIAEEVHDVAWSPDGKTLAAAGARGIWLLDTAAFTTPPRLLQVPNGAVYGVAFNPVSGLMATAHGDGTVRLWDVSTGGQRAVLRGHSEAVRAVAFSPSGSMLASGGGNEASGADSAIRLWDATTGTQIAVLQGHTAPVTRLAFNADGTLLASSSMDHTIRLWDVVSATPATVLENHTAPVMAVAFSPDGERLASAGEDGVRLWDIATRTPVAVPVEQGAVLALAFSPDGALLVSAGGARNGSGDNFVRLYTLSAGKDATVLDNYGASPGAAVSGITFSPDGTVLVFASFDVNQNQTVIRLWGVKP